jgi:hypothetical protein
MALCWTRVRAHGMSFHHTLDAECGMGSCWMQTRWGSWLTGEVEGSLHMVACLEGAGTLGGGRWDDLNAVRKFVARRAHEHEEGLNASNGRATVVQGKCLHGIR